MGTVGNKNFFLSVLMATLFFQASIAQDVTVRGGFFVDSLTVGGQTGFYLVAKYPHKINIAFPDSSFYFGPFEFVNKRYFPTRTTGGESYDSVIYYLSTFEIEPIQTLSLPVFQLQAQDCTIFNTDIDTIRLIELAKNLPDSITVQTLPLRANTIYENVPQHFNYPVLFIVLTTLLIVCIVVWIVFGNRIKKHFKMKKMFKAHRKFLDAYSQQVETVKASFSSTHTEHALVQWKRYMELLESRPYTKLTTRETTSMENNEVLGKNLHSIDGAIYGHNTTVVESLEHLRQFADQRFSQKLEEVKHG